MAKHRDSCSNFNFTVQEFRCSSSLIIWGRGSQVDIYLLGAGFVQHRQDSPTPALRFPEWRTNGHIANLGAGFLEQKKSSFGQKMLPFLCWGWSFGTRDMASWRVTCDDLWDQWDPGPSLTFQWYLLGDLDSPRGGELGIWGNYGDVSYSQRVYDSYPDFRLIQVIMRSGWWFGTWLLWLSIIKKGYHPSHWLIFFKMAIAPPTRDISES